MQEGKVRETKAVKPELWHEAPSIAQLVERWTVVGTDRQTSIGRWFESGSKENLLVV